MIQNLTKHQLFIWLDNNQSASAIDNIFAALSIVNGKIATVKKAKLKAAAVYARSLIHEGEDEAFVKLTVMFADSVDYSLNENGMNDLGYEFLCIEDPFYSTQKTTSQKKLWNNLNKNKVQQNS